MRKKEKEKFLQKMQRSVDKKMNEMEREAFGMQDPNIIDVGYENTPNDLPLLKESFEKDIKEFNKQIDKVLNISVALTPNKFQKPLIDVLKDGKPISPLHT